MNQLPLIGTRSPFNDQPRKTVGRRLEDLSLFDRLRRLQSSLHNMGLKQKNDGEYIRRTVGATAKK